MLMLYRTTKDMPVNVEEVRPTCTVHDDTAMYHDDDEKSKAKSAPLFSTKLFLKLMSQFPGLECLHFEDTFVAALDDVELLSLNKMLSNLNTFIADNACSGITAQIISLFCDNLKALSVRYTKVDIMSGRSFEKLEEFEIISCSGSLMDVVRQSACGLKRIHMDWMMDNGPLVQSLLSDFKLLEQVVISSAISELEGLCSAVERGIFNVMDSKKESLQIKFVVEYDSTIYKASDIVFHITRVLNALHSSRFDDVLFIWRFEGCSLPDGSAQIPAADDWESQMQHFVQRELSRFDITYSAHDILVKRTGSKISDCIRNCITTGWLTNVWQTES